jgi:hypothetical protein
MSGKEILTGRWATATRSLAPKPKPPRFCTRRRLASCCDEALRITYTINSILMRQSLWPGALHTSPWRGLPIFGLVWERHSPQVCPNPGVSAPAARNPGLLALAKREGKPCPALDRNPRGDNPRLRRPGRNPVVTAVVVVSSTSLLPSSRLAPPPPLTSCTLHLASAATSGAQSARRPLHERHLLRSTSILALQVVRIHLTRR